MFVFIIALIQATLLDAALPSRPFQVQEVKPPAQTFESAECGIRFRYPMEWMVAKADPAHKRGKCAFDLRPMDYKKRLAEYDVDSFSLSVDISEQPDLQAAADWAGFEKKPDGWVVFGRHGMESEASEIGNRKWKGVRGSTATGCYHVGPDGGYAGLCEVEIAMLFDPRKRAAHLFALPQAFDAFERVLESFEFLERRNGK